MYVDLNLPSISKANHFSQHHDKPDSEEVQELKKDPTLPVRLSYSP
jgi:hypothetical protein